MSNYKDLIEVTQEEKQEIKDNSPYALPLNPTQQGWSGQEVRKKMYGALINEKGSLLALLEDRLTKIGLSLDNLDDEIGFYEDYDIFIDRTTVYTNTLPLIGFREIDGVTLKPNDTVLVAGLGQEQNGIYIVGENGEWVLVTQVQPNQVISIDDGIEFGGSIQKKLSDGTTKMVKIPERQKWKVFI